MGEIKKKKNKEKGKRKVTRESKELLVDSKEKK